MSATLIALAIVYAVIGCVIARPVAGAKAWEYARRYDQRVPDSDDWAAAWALAFVAGVFWPFAAAVGVGYLLPRIGAERAAIARQRAEDQAKRIRDLERELELERGD